MFFILIGGLLAFVLTVISIPYFIKIYQKAKIGGQQMHEDVKQHQAKAGTPTMGGTVFLSVSLILGLVLAVLTKAQWSTYGILFILFLYGLIGFLDDFLKIFKQINEGLNPKQKLALQLLGGIIFYIVDASQASSGLLNVFGYFIHIGWFYVFFVLFWLIGFSNAVNLTDGIDGLSSISVVISLSAYGFIAYQQGQMDILILIAVIIGSLIGFFVYNKKPAKLFMGDVGSLALGGMLAALSIALHQEWTLLLIGLVYVIETASVMLQVAYFKYTKKKYGQGRRIFRMTPFHHHLELGGLSGQSDPWTEWQVDFFLWGVGAIMSLITLGILYF